MACAWICSVFLALALYEGVIALIYLIHNKIPRWRRRNNKSNNYNK